MALKYEDVEYEKKLAVYFDNFTEEQFQEYEDEIFGKKIDRKKRVELEFSRLKIEIAKDMKQYTNYYDELVELNKLLKVSDLSSDILDEAYKIIVQIQLACNINIRLYSALGLIKEEQELLSLKKKVGEANHGTKLNR